MTSVILSANGHGVVGRNGHGRKDDVLVSVVLPCLNEVDSVGLCVREAREAMAGAGLACEVVVVDNGSTDGSAAVAAANGARVIQEPAPGYGAALRAGIGAARGPVVVMADADLTYDLAKIEELVRPILDGDADLVLGSRIDGTSRKTMPMLHRFVGTPAITFLISRACGGRAPVRDSQSGFRAFLRQAVVDLGLASDGMEFASEMLIRASNAGLRIREVPTGYRERVGQSKLRTWSDGRRHLRLILALAPDLVLIGPGAVLVAIGLTLSTISVLRPSGLPLGSLHWQPTFFASIALVLGTQAVLAGAVIAYRLSLLSKSAPTRFDVIGLPSFPRKCMTGGAIAAATGLLLDAVLFVFWIGGAPAPSRALAVASIAQSLLIIGASFAMFSVMTRMLLARSTAFQAAPSLDEVAPLETGPAAGPLIELAGGLASSGS